MSTNIILSVLVFLLSPKRHADFCFKPSGLFFFLGEAKGVGDPNDILQNVRSMLGGDCKIRCIASNRQLFPQIGLHLEANKNAVFHYSLYIV